MWELPFGAFSNTGMIYQTHDYTHDDYDQGKGQYIFFYKNFPALFLILIDLFAGMIYQTKTQSLTHDDYDQRRV